MRRSDNVVKRVNAALGEQAGQIGHDLADQTGVPEERGADRGCGPGAAARKLGDRRQMRRGLRVKILQLSTQVGQGGRLLGMVHVILELARHAVQVAEVGLELALAISTVVQRGHAARRDEGQAEYDRQDQPGAAARAQADRCPSSGSRSGPGRCPRPGPWQAAARPAPRR